MKMQKAQYLLHYQWDFHISTNQKYLNMNGLHSHFKTRKGEKSGENRLPQQICSLLCLVYLSSSHIESIKLSYERHVG